MSILKVTKAITDIEQIVNLNKDFIDYKDGYDLDDSFTSVIVAQQYCLCKDKLDNLDSIEIHNNISNDFGEDGDFTLRSYKELLNYLDITVMDMADYSVDIWCKTDKDNLPTLNKFLNRYKVVEQDYYLETKDTIKDVLPILLLEGWNL